MNAKTYFERFVGPDGRAVVDSTTHIERLASGMYRLVSVNGVVLVHGADEVESALNLTPPSQPSESPAEAPSGDDSSDGTEPETWSAAELDAMLHDGESVRGAWPASDDAEPGHFEDTVGELEEDRMYGQVDDENEE